MKRWCHPCCRLPALALSVLMTVAVSGVTAQDAAAPVTAKPFDPLALARTTIERVVRPAAEKFDAATAPLAPAIEALCRSPSKRALQSVRKAFAAALSAHGALELYRFGPTILQNRQEKLLLYPDPKGLVRRQVQEIIAARDPSVLNQAKLAEKSVALQGFSALELLLYGPLANATATRSEAGRFQCGYATAIAVNIHAIARAIRADWDDPGGYATLMLTPSAENPAYLEAREVTLEIVSAFANGIELVRDVRLAGPLGMRPTNKTPTPELLPDSALLPQLLAANIGGLNALYVDSGLEARFRTSDDALAQLVSRELDTARKAALQVKAKPGYLTAKASRQSLMAMGFPLKNARSLFSGLVADSLQLSVGFNAGDGD